MTSTPDSELEYLSPGFDPGSLTIPKLRGIFVAHSIAYPSSAKKGQLVEIFNEKVAPNAKRILSSRSRTKRSARGIVDVPSSQEPSLSDENEDAQEEEEPALQPSRTPRTTSKKIPRKSVEDASSQRPAAAARSPKKKSRKSLSGNSGQGDVLMTESPTDTSPFSADNPFQSASSPLPSARSPSGERRRRTLGLEDSKERKKQTSPRRRSDYVLSNTAPTDSSIAPISRKITLPLSRVARDQDHDSAGEEFTPEEQQALALERQRTGVALRPAKRRKTSSHPGSFARLAPWAISLALLGGVGTVWRQEKISVGFCGVGKPSEMLAGVEIPEWANAVRPQCEPCPPHAYCYGELQASCESDFVLVPHPLSLGGLVPLPPTCEPDGEKARKVQAVADRAVAELRDRNAQFECGELKDEDGRRPETAELEEPELKEKVASKRRKGMSQEEFEELWQPALGEMMSRDEIVSDEHGQRAYEFREAYHWHPTNQILPRLHRHSERRTLRSVSLANIPLACAIRRSLRHALARHLWKLVALIAGVTTFLFGRARVTSTREATAKAKQLASFALDRLATQATLHAEDPGRSPEPWISMSQLRDDVLRDEFSTKRKQMLWEKVQKIVEDNANVRSMVREQRSGEISRVWEWIGALDLFAEDGGSSGIGRRRKSIRHSMSFGGDASPTITPAVKAEPEMAEQTNWNEGRPIY